MTDKDSDKRALRLQRATGRLFRRLHAEAGGASGLTLSQEWLVALLTSAPAGLSSAELAREQGVTAQTMSNAVAALVRRGLVRGEPDPADRRRTVLFATETGVATLRTSREGKLRWLTAALAELDDTDRRAVDDAVAVIERLVENGN